MTLQVADYYSRNTRLYVSVDCVIFGLHNGCLNILLIKRNFEPEKGRWSLMGGFVRPDESIDDAAKRVLYELTRLQNVYMAQVGAFGTVDRDPGERVVSVAYYALINFDEQDRLRAAEHNAHWIDINHIPELGFDHGEMIRHALRKMRTRLTREPIAFNLLPRLFTLTQLQSLYESVLGSQIDKRNFRRRITEMTCLEKTNQVDKSSSRRGAQLYRFNEEVYRQTNNIFRL